MRPTPPKSLVARLAGLLLALGPCAALAQDAPLPPPPMAQQQAEPPTDGTNQDGQAWHVQRWDNGRPASVSCDSGTTLLREGQCRIGAYSGPIVTYHENGAVHEVFHLNNGALDGILETFAPTGRLLTRDLWVDGVRQAPPPQPEPEEGPDPPPPLPVWIDVPFRPRFGLDVRLGLNFGVNSYTSFMQVGPLVSALYRFHPRLVLALTSGYLTALGGGSSDSSSGGADGTEKTVDYNSRYDVPITASVHLYFSRLTAFQLYVLGGLGAVYASAQAQLSPTETAWFTEMQLGAGIEQRFGRLLAFRYEIRLAGEFRTGGGPHVMVPDQNNNLQELMGHQFTTMFGFALAFLP